MTSKRSPDTEAALRSACSQERKLGAWLASPDEYRSSVFGPVWEDSPIRVFQHCGCAPAPHAPMPQAVCVCVFGPFSRVCHVNVHSPFLSPVLLLSSSLFFLLSTLNLPFYTVTLWFISHLWLFTPPAPLSLSLICSFFSPALLIIISFSLPLPPTFF